MDTIYQKLTMGQGLRGETFSRKIIYNYGDPYVQREN